MSYDLIRIGSQAAQGHQRSLQVTGNNIANLHTPGYVRERSVYSEAPFGPGISRVEIERMLDKFTQRQYWADTSKNGYTQAFLSESSKIDSVFGNKDSSINESISKFFAMMQDLNDDPASITQRELVIGQANSTLSQMQDMSQFLSNQERLFNEQLDSTVDKANHLILSISKINEQLNFIPANATTGERHTLLNERDEKIRELSELLNVSTLEDPNGRLRVNLASGEALVLEDGTYNLMALKGNPDPDRPELVAMIESGGKKISQGVNEISVGGKIGGLLAYRAEVLEPSQMKLGQLALGFADALNKQQALGMDLDNELGQPIFTFLGTMVMGQPASENQGTGQMLEVSLREGEMDKLVANNFEVEILSGNTYRIMPLDSSGQVIGDASSFPVYTISPPNGGGEDYGLDLDFTAGTFVAGDRFTFKPTKNAADSIQLAINRPEDLALSSPIRVANNGNNQGQGTVSLESLQGVSQFFTGDDLAANAPVQVTYLGFSGGQHQVEITLKDGSTQNLQTTDMKNIFSQVPALSPPDYDISISGHPEAGDVFTIAYNENAINDNSNGLALAELQRKQVIRRNTDNPTEANTLTLAEGYGRMVSEVGNKVSNGRTAAMVSEAMLQQSKQFYDSVAGVSLDEEAANLIQYEQAYNAAARVISVAQQVFDTLLNATR